MARQKQYGRSVNGILLLDKPIGVTSNQILQQVKRLYQANKAGHTGSLDPLATGLLPICFGEATKVSAFLLDADKRYQVTLRFGIKTTTADAEGAVLSQREVPPLTQEQLQAVLYPFQGKQWQIPPMYSALKHQGQCLYKLARQGETIERQPREIVIDELSLVSWQSPDLTLDVACSKGTYIRTLAEDIGEAVGCGAFVVALRRTGLGSYPPAPWITWEDLQALREPTALEQLLLPIDSALTQWPALVLPPEGVYGLVRGQSVQVPHVLPVGSVRLYDNQHFLGIGQILADGRINPRRLINTNL